MEIQDFLETVLFVIVVYRQPVPKSAAWTSLESEIANLRCKTNLLIYDNSPEPQVAPDSTLVHIYYHHNPSNAGVSAAYNFANRLSLHEGNRWLLLLDQDTQLSRGSLLQYHKAFNDHPDSVIFAPILRDKKGIVSPFTFRLGGGVRVKSARSGVISLKKYKAINSGLLINSDAFQRAGGYEDSLRLDFSDLAFLRKFQTVDEKLMIVNTVLQHNFSGSVRQEYQKTLDRFKIYCEAAELMGGITGHKILFWFRSFLRALHLTCSYGHVSFLRIHHQTWSKSR